MTLHLSTCTPVSLTSMPDDLSTLAAGLAGRLRSLVIAIDRLDRLESGSGEWRAAFADEELEAAVHELTLRGLRTAADATNFSVLKYLAARDSASLGQLLQATGLGRLVLSEHLNDLVQVGLATRLIDTDHAQITSAGAAVVHMIDDLTEGVRESYLGETTRG